MAALKREEEVLQERLSQLKRECNVHVRFPSFTFLILLVVWPLILPILFFLLMRVSPISKNRFEK